MPLLRVTLPAAGDPTYPRKNDLFIVDEAHNVAPCGRSYCAEDSQHFKHSRCQRLLRAEVRTSSSSTAPLASSRTRPSPHLLSSPTAALSCSEPMVSDVPHAFSCPRHHPSL